MTDYLVKYLGMAVILLVAGACAEDSYDISGPMDRTVRVMVEPVHFTNEQTRVEAVGTSRAIQSATLSPVTSGEVVSVKFEPGQRVEQGSILVELDSRNERLAVELAKIRLEDAQRLLDRYQRSSGSGAVLPTTLDAARTAYESARVELDKSQNALDDRMIRAPFTGYVGITDVDPGDRVTPSTEITTLDNRDMLLVSFDVPEILIGTLRVGERIAINAWTERASTDYGDIVDIGSRIDPVSRTFTARARVDNRGDRLRPGMSFRVSLEIKGDVYPVIPEIAVQWGTEGPYIWSVRNDQAYRVSAEIIQRQQGKVLVSARFIEGDLIVVEGIQRMYEGIKVRHELVPAETEYEEVKRNVNIES